LNREPKGEDAAAGERVEDLRLVDGRKLEEQRYI